jgi:hypothetical protein
MARVDKGNALTSKMLQPGWTYQNDGFGLVTGAARFMVNKGSEGTAILYGDAHPQVPYIKVQKIQHTYQKNGIVEIQVDYIGISPAFFGGLQTNPNVTPSGSLSSEHITTNINFFSSDPEKAIAGDGTTFTASTIATNPQEYVGGKYGAHFETDKGGAFRGFKDPSTNLTKSFYGKSSYLAASTSFNGVVYTTELANVKAVIKDAGTRNSKGVFGGLKLFSDWLDQTDWVSPSTRWDQLLLTQVSVEDFSIGADKQPKLWKINYEIRYSRDGYPNEVYEQAATQAS